MPRLSLLGPIPLLLAGAGCMGTGCTDSPPCESFGACVATTTGTPSRAGLDGTAGIDGEAKAVLHAP